MKPVSPVLHAAAFHGLLRGGLFAGLIGVGFLNAIFEKVTHSVLERGALTAAFETFGISVLVWLSIVVVVYLLVKDTEGQPVSSTDSAMAVLASLAFLIPHEVPSWLALNAVALYIMRSTPASGPAARAGAILLALTIPVFWTRLAMSLFSDAVLQFDAVLVAALAGTARIGNLVAFADGSGSLWIAPACSSLANVSLAILCAVLVVKAMGASWTPRAVAFSVLACLSVVAINVVRIAVVAMRPDQFELVHGPAGATAANWLSAAVVLGLCLKGVAHARRLEV